MKTLKDFILQFDFVRMKPDNSVIKGGLPEKAKAYALVEPGKQYAIYLFGGTQANLALELPRGRYTVEWWDPITGVISKKERLKHGGGTATLATPAYSADIALRVTRF
jgi:hypothetical protein